MSTEEGRWARCSVGPAHFVNMLKCRRANGPASWAADYSSLVNLSVLNNPLWFVEFSLTDRIIPEVTDDRLITSVWDLSHNSCLCGIVWTSGTGGSLAALNNA